MSNKKSKPIFRIGDRVWSAFGRKFVGVGEANGTVEEVDARRGTIYVYFDRNPTGNFFLPDGRVEDWHSEPSLFHAKPNIEIVPPNEELCGKE